MGTEVVGESKSIEYSTPLALVNPLIEEFELTRDVCASKFNHKFKVKFYNIEFILYYFE